MRGLGWAGLGWAGVPGKKQDVIQDLFLEEGGGKFLGHAHFARLHPLLAGVHTKELPAGVLYLGTAYLLTQ